MKKQNLVFFDLDNTLLNIDSSYVFIRKYYNSYILFYSFLRKFRIINKSTFYSKITKHCEMVLVNEKRGEHTKSPHAYADRSYQGAEA